MAFQIHDWERPDFDWENCEDSDEEPYQDPATVAAKEFLEILLDQYMESAISAEIVCTLCHFANLGGLVNVSQYGLAPGGHSSNYKVKLDRCLGFTQQRRKEYSVDIVGKPLRALGRQNFQINVINAHEALEEEFQRDASISVKLGENINEGVYPDTYYSHPVVRANPNELVLPAAIYMDGIAYSQTDTVLGIWIINMVTGTRHLLAAVRKRLVCQCGCCGGDTYFPLLLWLLWTLECCASGLMPNSRHDKSDWSPQDLLYRAALSGTLMAFKVAVVMIKGDWAEFCDRFGFPTWQSNKTVLLLCWLPP